MPHTSNPQFEIYQTYATPAVAEFLTNDEAATLLQFHTRGHWDEMDSEDTSENEISFAATLLDSRGGEVTIQR